MDYIRQKVSGKKNRLKEGNFNLDLTYITQRIIAMSLPGEGFEGLYRNPIDQVAQYLNERHKEDYFIFNLSGKNYDESKFKGLVFKDYFWKDHHSPSLNVLFDICLQIHNILKANEENVVVIHCLAGKGRTGTVICCYLLYSGRFDNVTDALSYYGKKRFHGEGLSVNQPCQLKYIEYFYTLLNMNTRIFPNLIQIQSISFFGRSPQMNINGQCYPYVEIIDVKKDSILYSTKQMCKKYAGQNHRIILPNQIPLVADILINVKNYGTLSDSKMFRFSFNTAFIEKHVTYQLNELDPTQIQDDQRFDKQFRVELEIEKCRNCSNLTTIEQKCQICKPHLIEHQETWSRINEIINRYVKPTESQTTKLLFRTKQNDDVEAILKDEVLELTNSLYFKMQLREQQFTFYLIEIILFKFLYFKRKYQLSRSSCSIYILLLLSGMNAVSQCKHISNFYQYLCLLPRSHNLGSEILQQKDELQRKRLLKPYSKTLSIVNQKSKYQKEQ
ncbi:unnamed protein product (macronuclear) [Paramecium tetraurelia]|uniref:Uncharacterized protein n=1 Tax=Paramecium tetraurelia TaxID=5888 RepID=A0BC98_PARTE|nr:uncharacterized protein GSPATT00004259001 [Paramecium tetraurelia]CAK56165.1 unnamed protein product [Paramecium tetraurelia]|eukprot:XP_001423563.1 hypothetical protein (macronuclear) [Paramecium tetraurelia strain d4-2]